MDRFLRILAMSFFVGSLLACTERTGKQSAKEGEPSRPNILFIFADDWGWGDLSAHGHPYVKTPNIDRLVAEGTDFHRFTVASGVCSPSRAAVLSGHFPARFNINGHFAWVPQNAQRNMPDWLDNEATLLPSLLQQSGYVTAHFGKWHLSNNMIPDSPTPARYGYDTYGAFNCSGEQMPFYEDADKTIEFMENARRENQPFFINLWIHEPHTPHHVIPKYQWGFRELEETDNIYASVLSHADERIGKVLDALDRLNLTENTLVVFSSDNGPARAATPTALETYHDTATGVGYNIAGSKGITGGRKGYKAALFEGGIGVPFIARWPGKIKAGAVDSVSLISAVDLLPTFCEIAGVQLPDSYSPDGISQLGTLKGTPYPSRTKPLFWKMDGSWPINKNKPYHWVSYAIVDQNWKLVGNSDLSYVELYDITKDVYEQHDLKEENTEVVERLVHQIEEWQSSLPDKPDNKLFSEERNRL
ncbi:arylsulfatase A-like enzyme [Catalinimonas alkaloidigena]|uniref:sulfatase family protein n=1 Tax=Catalinimonas alkaloidigena TaxID=1075417 RepID=UPI002404D9A1|nr:sulfatase-like hydrolase/transferase [Catalinimonas alkaloidigena]MDF9799253.1 arylsulfatase A-like enzyme [Catalinimonas alkaloidigena]